MARKRASAKSQSKPRPDTAQLKAIERMLEEGRYREAVPRIQAALERFPDHGGLHRALVEALERSRGPQLAAVAAFAWAECRPNSLPAQQALLGLAISLGHLLLADRTAAKVRGLGGQTPGFPLDSALTRSFLEELGAPEASLDAVVRFDIGRLHLEGQDFAGALRWLDGVDIPPARNNRALALFHLDRIDEARDAFLTNWERHPDNLFALGWAVRLRLYQGDATGALGLCTPLAAADARRPDDALAQVAVLLLLRQDQAAWDAFERARDQEWFDRHGDRTRAMVRHVGACAAGRLGNEDAAQRWWQAALDMEPDLALATANLDPASDASSPSRWPGIFEYDNTLPQYWIKALREEGTGGAGMLDTLSASNAYLEALYLGGDPTLRTLVGFVVKRRVEHGDDAAAGLLREFARLPIGTKEDRLRFLNLLRSHRFVGPGEAAEFWDGTQLQKVRITGTEIHREPAESGLSDELDQLLSDAIARYNAGQPDEAAKLLNKILEEVPDHPIALGNLAAVRSMQGQAEGSRRLLEQVVERHPDYLFGRCNLAQMLIRDGAVEAADRLLDGYVEHDRLHIQDAFMLWGTQAMLYTAKGEDAAARSLLTNLESMVEDEDDARRLEGIKQSIDRLDLMKRFEQNIKALVRRGRKGAKRSR